MITLPGYQIKDNIFESNNSLIFKGVFEAENKPVILKALKDHLHNADEIARYRQEFEILKLLKDNPNVINAYSFETYSKTPIIVLEDFGGISLKDHYFKNHKSIKDSLQLAIKIIKIIEGIHEAGIIHKDINPSNILINENSNQIKLIDFGISSVLPKETPTLINPLLSEGSLSYISPEQTGRMNQNLDYRTDFYSFGISLYQMLTNELPFKASDTIELIHCHLAQRAILPHEINSDIPIGLSHVVMKLISKNAEGRYQSTVGIAEDLKQCSKISEGELQESNFVLGTSDISEKFQIPQKLYGREKEIDTLLSAFHRINQKSGKNKSTSELVLVNGFSGVGKTTLVQEIYKPVTKFHGYFISGKFEQYQKQKPYLAIVEAFTDFIKQLLMESENQLSVWKNKLSSTLGNNAQIIIDVIPELELIIGPQERVPNLPPLDAQNRFNIVFQSFIEVFISTENPVVVFLDDLQWADLASLKLLEYLITNRESNFLLIGAYRENEVESSHPLITTQKKLLDNGVKITLINVSPLDVKVANRFIAETLGQDEFSTKSLSELVVAKTDGNPFFIVELLKSLYEYQAIEFNRQKGFWQWSLEKVNKANVSENIVDLMAQKLKRLDPKSQQVLKVAACIGNRFSLELLSCFLELPALETVTALKKIMVTTPGLIYSIGEPYKLAGRDSDISAEFKFMHDRIQQAAYSLIPVVERKNIHHQFSKLIIDLLSETNKEEKIFDIVNQTNKCLSIITDSVEKTEIAKFNLIAGKKAKKSAAYSQALEFLTIGISLLDDQCWQNDYELALQLFTEGAEAAYLCGNFTQVNELTRIALENISDLMDRVKVHEILIQSSYGKGEPQKAIKQGLNILNLLGYWLPKNPNSVFLFPLIIFELLRLKFNLKRKLKAVKSKEIHGLAETFKETHEPNLVAASRIFGSIASSLQISHPLLLCFGLIKGIRMFLRHGISRETPFFFSGYGMLLCSGLGNYKDGISFGELALALIDRFKNKNYRGKVNCVVSWAIQPRKIHFEDTLDSLVNAVDYSLESGDIEYASHSIHMYLFHQFLVGMPLVSLKNEMETYGNTVSKFKQTTILQFIKIHHQSVLNLLGYSKKPDAIEGEEFSENLSLPDLIGKNDHVSLLTYYIQKNFLCYIFEDFATASATADKIDLYSDSFPSPTLSLAYLYGSLSRLVQCDVSNSKVQKKKLVKKVKTNQAKLKKWASYAPMNFLNKWTLVQAELQRILGQDSDAAESFDKAIDLSKQNGFVQEEALSNELAAKFWLKKGKTHFAKLYLTKAFLAYQQWGSFAKLKQLRRKYPDLLSNESKAIDAVTEKRDIVEISQVSSSTDSDSSLDLKSVIKASQAMSSEILLPSLLKKMMSILIENTGAERGWLLIENDNQYLVEAMKEARDRNATVLESVSLKDPVVSQTLPLDIVHYVTRTSETVVLDNATQDGKFVKDQNLARREVKSVLCSPILSQNKTLGIVYLENNLAKGAFTNNRVEILQHLSSYMAISIENARLYEDLKESEEKYRGIFEKAKEGIFQSTVNGEILEANPAFIKIFGYSSLQELKERFNLLSDNLYVDKERKNERIELLNEKGFAENFEYQALKCNGSIIDVSENVRLAKNEDNKTVYLEGIITDISQKKHLEELKSAKEKSDAANQAKTDFLADISHELRTPMHGILGFAKLGIFKARSKNVEKMIEYYEEIKKSGERLLLLLNDLLDLSKLEAGRISIDYNYVSVSELIITIIKELHPLSSEKGLGIIYDKPAFSDKAEIDGNKMGQVVRNLISNAIKFSDEGGQVKVSLLDNDFDFQISVEDEGIGIPENELITVFDKFKQSSRTKSSGEGTGLGLAISKQIIKSHHGQIWAENNPRGGTIFHCSFPKSRKN